MNQLLKAMYKANGTWIDTEIKNVEKIVVRNEKGQFKRVIRNINSVELTIYPISRHIMVWSQKNWKFEQFWTEDVQLKGFKTIEFVDKGI